MPAVGVTEWRLSNGVRVLVKPTDFKADEVLFSAYSPGGIVAGAERRLHVGGAGDADRRHQRARARSAGRSSEEAEPARPRRRVRIDRRDERRLSGSRVAEGSRDDVPADLSDVHRAAPRHGRVPGVQESGRAVPREPRRRSGRGVQRHRAGDDVAAQLPRASAHAGDVRRGRIRRRRSRSTRIASPTRATSRSSFVGNVDTLDAQAARREATSRRCRRPDRKETFRDVGRVAADGRRRAHRAEGRGAEGEHD